MLYQKIKRQLRVSLCAFLSILLLSPVYAFRSQFIVPSNSEEDLFLSHYNTNTDAYNALVASGVEAAMFTFYESEIKRWKEEIEASLPPYATEKTIAKQIGYYLHDHVYKRYQLEATTLKEVFEQGLFNCLSGTVLMNILLRMFGIEARSVVLPTHVYTLATLDGQDVEIENTIREGLAISEDKEIQRRFNQLTGFNYTNNKNKKVVIGWNETLGLLYSNRSFFNAQKKQHYKAFQNMLKAQVFLANSPSEEHNLIAGYLNYSYYMYNDNRSPLSKYLMTLSILEEGISRFPHYQNLRGNYLKGLDLVLEKMLANNADNNDLFDLVNSAEQFLRPNEFKKLQKNLYIRAALYNLRTNQNFPNAKSHVYNLWQLSKDDQNTQALVKEYSYATVKDALNKKGLISPNMQIVNDLSVFPNSLTKEAVGCYFSTIAQNNYNAKLYQNSVNIMKQAFELIGRTPLVSQNGFAHAVNAANVNIENQNYNEAIQFYKEALFFKKDRNVINNLGVLYEQMIEDARSRGDIQTVTRLAKESLTTVPNHPRLRQIQLEFQ